MTTPARQRNDRSTNWILIRDLAGVQVKLIFDGFRDLLLLPASVIAALLSLVRSRDGEPGPEFYRLLLLGKQSERFINLFGALRHAPPDVVPDSGFAGAEMDELFSRIETFVVNEYQRGGITAQAKSKFDELLDRMRSKKGPDPL